MDAARAGTDLRGRRHGRRGAGLCDGERDLAGIVAELAARYAAPPAVIEKDVVAMLADLKAKRVLET